VNDIKMDLGETEWNDVDWILSGSGCGSVKGFVNTVMKLRFPQNAGKLLISCTIGVFSRRAQLHCEL
jgi:hypothetical protein